MFIIFINFESLGVILGSFKTPFAAVMPKKVDEFTIARIREETADSHAQRDRCYRFVQGDEHFRARILEEAGILD